MATSRSQGDGVERPILLNNQLGVGKSAKSTKNGSGMLPKTVVSGVARRGEQQNTILGVMGHFGPSFDGRGTGSEGRCIEIRNNQFKKQKDELKMQKPFVLTLLFCLRFLTGNTKISVCCKNILSIFKLNINYFIFDRRILLPMRYSKQFVRSPVAWWV